MVVIYYYLQRVSDNVLKSHIDSSSYFEIVAKTVEPFSSSAKASYKKMSILKMWDFAQVLEPYVYSLSWF